MVYNIDVLAEISTVYFLMKNGRNKLLTDHDILPDYSGLSLKEKETLYDTPAPEDRMEDSYLRVNIKGCQGGLTAFYDCVHNPDYI